jgi:hypothetical protein
MGPVVLVVVVLVLVLVEEVWKCIQFADFHRSEKKGPEILTTKGNEHSAKHVADVVLAQSKKETGQHGQAQDAGS